MVIAFDEEYTCFRRPTNNRMNSKTRSGEAEFGDGTSLYEAVEFT